MDDATARVAASFDRVADLYRHEFAAELDRNPFDRELLARLARRFPAGGAVLEVGAGPAQASAFLAGRGVPVVASDVSQGQLREGAAVAGSVPLVAADLAHLPVRRGGLAGIVAFYCLIYTPAEELDSVFAEWHRALLPDGIVAIAVHAGVGSEHFAEWRGRAIDVTIVLRDPDDLCGRLEAAGFVVEERTVRPPYEHEHQADHCHVVARRALAA